MAYVELKVLEGEQKGLVLCFSRPECVLFGRAPDAGINIPDDQFVSRHHFLLEISPPYVLLSDLGSKNGFYVNDTRFGGRDQAHGGEAKKVQTPRSVFLSDGDQIVVGQNRMVVGFWDTNDQGFSSRRKTSGRRINPFSGMPTPTMGDLFPQTTIGNYRINHEIGRGWMGATYQAVDTASGQLVTIKTVVPNVVFTQEDADLFLREATRLESLSNPCTCRVIDSWQEGNVFFLAQEHVDGADLGKFLAGRGGKLKPEEAFPLLLDLLEGLSMNPPAPADLNISGELREKPWLPCHRNIKPRNFLVYRKGRAVRGKVVDYGLYPAIERAGLNQLILSGLYQEAPYYWPRERITCFHRPTPASDVFSAAAVCYEILTGCLARDGLPRLRDEARKAGRIPGLGEFLAVMAEFKPVPIRDRDATVPPRVAAVIDRALAEPIIPRDLENRDEEMASARFRDFPAFRAALLEAMEADGVIGKGGDPDQPPTWDLPGEQKEAAILVLDLASSTQLVNNRGTAIFTGIVNFFNRIFRNHESASSLKFLKCTGDGFFAVYEQPGPALEAARKIVSEALASEIQIRIALNWGLITIAGDGDFLGKEVHRLFRIEGLKESDRVSGLAIPIPPHGRILATRSVAETNPGFFKNIGFFRLKGFDEPCEIFLFKGG